MKHSIILAALLALTALTAAAKSVVFTLTNGTLVYYLIGGEKNPVMKFTDGKIVVNTDEYEFSGVKNFYISETDDPAAISSATASSAPFSWRENVLTVKASAGDVRIYNVNGTQCDAETSEHDGAVSVNLASCPKGAYIIKVGNESFKVVKK